MSTKTQTMSEFNAAKRLYAEQFGDAIVTNTYLKIALLALSLIAAGLIYANIKTARMVQNFKPLVIRINDIGRAEAINYNTLAYKPQEAEIKYFLSEFCRRYYSRNRFTIRDNFSQALLFMDMQLQANVSEAWTKQKIINSGQDGNEARSLYRAFCFRIPRFCSEQLDPGQPARVDHQLLP
jgi:type IV secretory pathway TrbF-like protein